MAVWVLRVVFLGNDVVPAFIYFDAKVPMAVIPNLLEQ